MAVKKRRRAATSPIDRANQKPDEEFVSSYLAPGAPGAAPWTTQWIHPQTGAAYQISLACSGNVGEDALKDCFALIEETSHGDYDKSAQGWRPVHKRREMREVDLRYILVRECSRDKAGEDEGRGAGGRQDGDEAGDGDEDGDEDRDGDGDEDGDEDGGDGDDRDEDDRKANGHVDMTNGLKPGAIRGFTSLMPTYEEGQPVVYCYEIHLKPELRGTGLSAVLLGFLYTVAYNLPPISKVMLTCFLSNERALRFYRKQGFDADDVSPEARTLRGKTFMPDYTIMSKPVAR